MKTRIWQTLTVLLTLMLGISAARANAADVSTSKTTNSLAVEVAAPPANAAPVAAPATTDAEPVKVLQFPKPGLPAVLDQVVRLSEAGTDESVIRAYIEKAAPAYRITGNEIVQLHDLGISQGVILSLIDHSKSAPSDATEVAAQTPEPRIETPPQSNAVASAPEAANDFYDALSPYGSWLDVPGYGPCWQPTVVVVNPGWRPYCDAGDWLWSDCGWYWHSYYSWGWAPFHYGRWFSHPHRGWLWCPDRTWGPSWVCWRNSGNFCGWAPLPPGAHFSAGGWRFHGAHVGVDFGFGLGPAHFTFVSHDHFTEHHVGAHVLRGQEASTAFRNTTVINNFAVGANNRIINHGIGREQIAAATHTSIREVAVRDLPHGANSLTMPDRVSRNGNSAVVFRPGAQASAARNTGLSTVANRLARGPARSVAPSTSLFAPRASAASGASPRGAMPSQPMNSFSRSPAVQANRNWNTAPSARATPTYRSPAFARPAAPTQTLPRSVTPSQSFAPRSSFGSGGSFGSHGSSRGGSSYGGTAHSSFGAHR